jgi:hypothetical protein
MNDFTIRTKVLEIVEKELMSELEMLHKKAEGSELEEFERALRELGSRLLTATAELLMCSAAENIEPKIRETSYRQGFRKLEKRVLTIRIFTGHVVKIPNLYAKQVGRGYEGKRHLMALHWGIRRDCSASYLSMVCSMAMLSPSFEIAHQLLDIQGISYDAESIRKLVLYISNYCKTRQAELSRRDGESLSGKRVFISLDGGRTRCREYKGQINKAGNEQFETSWHEPKMFVLGELDEAGKTINDSIVYGTMFGVDDIFELLKSHLIGLDIALARQVQIAADGALWIWNRTKELLISLGVCAHKIVETIDYYHAAQHLHDLLKQISKRKLKKENPESGLKTLLWNGNTDEIVKQFNTLFPKRTKEIERNINYFVKNKERMQYADFQANNLLVGSGIMESGIRRVINLRFKNASSFWNLDNVEGLFFLRSTFLAGRWKNMINKLTAPFEGHKS